MNSIRQRHQLKRFIPEGMYGLINMKKYRTRGLIIPRAEKDAMTRLLKSSFRGCFRVLYLDTLGGNHSYRALETDITPTDIMTRPDMKIRLQVVSSAGESLGFIEPELFYGFVPDWEDGL